MLVRLVLPAPQVKLQVQLVSREQRVQPALLEPTELQVRRGWGSPE